MPGLRVAKLTGYRLEEIAAQNANQQGGSEQDYRVKAGVIAPSPIDTVLNIQPERSRHALGSYCGLVESEEALLARNSQLRPA